MYALPPDLNADEQVTGIGCPACPGVLQVTVEGRRGYFHFVCRIGHSFSLEELFAAKEKRIEDSFWAAVISLEELARLIEDLERQGALPRRGVAPGYAQRRERALTNARMLRDLIERDR